MFWRKKQPKPPHDAAATPPEDPATNRKPDGTATEPPIDLPEPFTERPPSRR